MKKIFLLASVIVPLISIAQSPALQWVKSIGGSSADIGKSITTDAAGNIYATGYFSGTVDFDPGPGVTNLTSSGVDAFILKLNATGDLIWAKNTAGIVATNKGWDIAVDLTGNVYVTGPFQSTTDFDPSSGVFNMTSAGSSDIYILKLSSSGNFVWVKGLGSTGGDSGYSLDLDNQNNIYVTGSFQGTVDFDPGSGVYNLTSSFFDAFVLKLNSSGNFVWAKNIGGNMATTSGQSIYKDPFGSIYTSGFFSGTSDFNPGSGTDSLAAIGGDDIFILKLDTLGNFIWAKTFGGNGVDRGYCIKGNASGYIYVNGEFAGTADFDPGAGTNNLIATGGYDVFVSKFDASGNLTWAKRMGGSSFDYSTSVALDLQGNVYTAGYFTGTADFDPGIGTVNLISDSTNNDVFISKLDSVGNFVWAGNMGGTGDDRGYSNCSDASGNIYTLGQFYGTGDFDPNSGTVNLSSSGNADIFIHKMGSSSSGINENTDAGDFIVYPNPSNGVFNVIFTTTAKTALIEVYNGVGACVFKQSTTVGTNRIDLTDLAKGLYFVQLTSDSKIIGAKKLIKQ